MGYGLFALSAPFPGKNTVRPQEQFYWYEQITGEVGASSAPPDASPVQRLLHRPPLLLFMWLIWLGGYTVIYVGVATGLLFMLRQSPGTFVVMLALLLSGFFLPGPLADVRFRVPVVPYVVLLYTTGLLHLNDSK